MSADLDPAGIRIIKTHQQVDQCCLSTSGRSNDCNTLSRLHMQIKIFDQMLIRNIGEIYILNIHRSVCLF